MKLPQIHRPKIDLRSTVLQTTLEIAAGGILCAALMKWVEM